jgi:transcriptional regulator with XRE-family HTH domain
MDYRRAKEVIRDLRNEQGLSVPELARRALIHKTTLYRIEEDIKLDPDRPIDFETIEQLVSALGITLAEFFNRVERVTVGPVEAGTAPDARALSGLPHEYQLSGHELRMMVNEIVDERLRTGRRGGSSSARPRGGGTKSARARRR